MNNVMVKCVGETRAADVMPYLNMPEVPEVGREYQHWNTSHWCNRELRGGHIVGGVFSCNAISNVVFRGTVFKSCVFRSVEFTNCDMITAAFKDCAFVECKFVDCISADPAMAEYCRIVDAPPDYDVDELGNILQGFYQSALLAA